MHDIRPHLAARLAIASLLAAACGGVGASSAVQTSATLVAAAGADQAVTAGATVMLDGSGSSPAGPGLRYAWSQTGGLPVTLSGAATVQPTFTAPAMTAGQPPLTLAFSLVVSEGVTSSAPASGA